METCDNCGANIGKLETPRLWNNAIVCPKCEMTLREQSKRPAMIKGGFRWGKFIAIVVLIVVLLFAADFLWIVLKPRHSAIAQTSRLRSPVTPVSSGNVVVNYDKFKNNTVVVVGYPDSPDDGSGQWNLLINPGDGYVPSKSPDTGVIFEASYIFQGNTITELYPRVHFMFLEANGSNSDAPPPVFLLNGTERIQMKDVLGKMSQSADGGYLTIEECKKLTAASSVEIQTCNRDCKMTQKQQAAIGELLDAIGATQ